MADHMDGIRRLLSVGQGAIAKWIGKLELCSRRSLTPSLSHQPLASRPSTRSCPTAEQSWALPRRGNVDVAYGTTIAMPPNPGGWVLGNREVQGQVSVDDIDRAIIISAIEHFLANRVVGH